MDKSMAQMMKDNWNRGRKLKDGLPDGEYVMRVQDASMAESKNGNSMIKREFLVVEGEFSGQIVFDNVVMASDFGCAQAAKFLEVMGKEVPDDPSDIEDVVASIAADGATVRARAKSRDGFTNITVLELLEAEESSDEDDAAEEAPSEEDSDAESGGDDDDADGAEESSEAEDDAGDGDREALVAFAAAQDVEGVDESSSAEEIADAIKGYSWDASDLTDEEVALLEKIGAQVEKPAKPAKPAPKAKPAAKPAKPAAKPVPTPKKAAKGKK